MKFKTKASYGAWLTETVIETQNILEQEFSNETGKEHAKAVLVWTIFYNLMRYIEDYKNSDYLIPLFNDKKLTDKTFDLEGIPRNFCIEKLGNDIFKIKAIQYFIKAIVKISVYKKNSKDSKSPETEAHEQIKGYLLSANHDAWSDKAFLDLLKWHISETKISYAAKTITPQDNKNKIDIFERVETLLESGENKTNAMGIVSDDLYKATIRREYKSISESKWAQGAGRIITNIKRNNKN